MSVQATVSSQPITATVSGDTILANVPATAPVQATVTGGIGPQGPIGASGVSSWLDIAGKPATFAPSAHTHTSTDISDFASAAVAAAPPTVDASLLTKGTLSAARLPASAVLTTDMRLSDARQPLSHQHAIGDVSDLQASLNAKATPADVAAAQAHAVQRANHTGTQDASTIAGLATVATSGSYNDLTNKPSIPPAFTLTAATASVLGGVKQGANVTIAADGTISVAAPVTTLPAASIAGLANVATSGAYADLSGLPQLGTAAAAAAADFAAASHTHSLSSLTQSSATPGQVPAWNGSTWAPATPASGASSFASFVSSSGFPGTGSASVLYLDQSRSRLYRWVAADSVYAEVGTIGGLVDSLDGGSYA